MTVLNRRSPHGDRDDSAAATEREEAMLADLKACAEVIGDETLFGMTLRRNIAAYEREQSDSPSPEWAVREYEALRDNYLTLRAAISEARRELWWFIENDEPNGEIAARAIRIQDEILGKALNGTS
jgi:hypothetical protein